MSRRYLSGQVLVAAMCLAEVLCMAGFATYPALLPRLAAEWQINNAESGLVGGILFCAYVAGVPILTSLTDRMDARHIYVGASLVAASGSLIFGLFANGIWVAMVGQALFGLGFAGMFMPGLKALSDRIDASIQSRAVAMYTALSGVGLGASFALAGWLADISTWRAAFLIAAAGPLISGAIVCFGLMPLAPPRNTVAVGFFKGFRLVLKNRPALAYILGYTAHCWELYGLRSWLVGFLTFAQGHAIAAADGGPLPFSVSPTVIAGVTTLIGIVTSIGCNELARSFLRSNVVSAVMLLSPLTALAVGASGAQSFTAAIILAGFYYGLVMADSALLTAGTVAAAAPGQRGTTMAVHSAFGFAAGLFAPIIFGGVLDLLQGINVAVAWVAAFASLSIPSIAAAIAVRRFSSAPAAAAG